MLDLGLDKEGKGLPKHLHWSNVEFSLGTHYSEFSPASSWGNPIALRIWLQNVNSVYFLLNSNQRYFGIQEAKSDFVQRALSSRETTFKKKYYLKPTKDFRLKNIFESTCKFLLILENIELVQS